jgi:hypothetical protein
MGAFIIGYNLYLSCNLSNGMSNVFIKSCLIHSVSFSLSIALFCLRLFILLVQPHISIHKYIVFISHISFICYPQIFELIKSISPKWYRAKFNVYSRSNVSSSVSILRLFRNLIIVFNAREAEYLMPFTHIGY